MSHTTHPSPSTLRPYVDPDGVPNYVRRREDTYELSIDWTDMLAEMGDTIASDAWTVEGGLTKNSEATASNVSTVNLTGTSGEATCTLTTTGGLTVTRKLKVRSSSDMRLDADYGRYWA